MDAFEPTSPVEKFIFKQIKEQYEFENDESTYIDTAATNLIGWNGLIISVLLTGGGILISKGTLG